MQSRDGREFQRAVERRELCSSAAGGTGRDRLESRPAGDGDVWSCGGNKVTQGGERDAGAINTKMAAAHLHSTHPRPLASGLACQTPATSGRCTVHDPSRPTPVPVHVGSD